eukprot:7907044-Alexandrium_andersonii.AAC.1
MLTISDRLDWGKIEVLTDSKLHEMWRIPAHVSPTRQYASPEVQRAAREIAGLCPTEEQGGRRSTQPQVFYKGVGWGQIGLNSDPQEGGRAFQDKHGVGDVA